MSKTVTNRGRNFDADSHLVDERLRIIIDTIPTIVWSKLPDGSADFLNRAFREYTGFSLEQGLGWGWMNAFHPDDRLVDEWRANLAAGEPFEKEARLRRADGEYRWFLIRSVPLRDAKGTPVKWYGTSTDIDDLKRAEDRVRLVINTIPTMVWTVQANGGVDFVNQRWMDYTGLSLDEIMKDPTGPVHPEDLSRAVEKWLADMAAGEPSEDEMRLRRADGEYRWFLVRTAPLRDAHGDILKWYGVSIDIEDRKQSERRSRVLLDAIPQQIWSGPPDGTLDYCNERWRAYSGLGLEEIQGKGWQRMLHPDDRERVLTAWRAAVTQGTPYEQEERHRRADGTYRWFLARGIPFRDATGRIIRWYGTNTDIEDRKQADEELRRLSGQLLRLQDEERRKIARDLHDSTAHHLVLLTASLQQMQTSIAPLSSKALRLFSEAEDFAAQALREVRTLSYLLYPPMLDESGLEDAISHYVEGYSKRSGVQVDVQVSPNLGRLGRDTEMALFRVVQESLTNVQLHSGSRRAWIRLERMGDSATLEIRDEGDTGRNPESRRSVTTGVGIPSMRERVTQMSGHLEIESSNAGTTIRATIPVNDKR